MDRVKFPYIGSFQHGLFYNSESPINELWDRIRLLGSIEYLNDVCSFREPDNKCSLVSYASVRIQQAVEFYEAAKGGSLLSSPLSLYYSLLNLVRACLAIKNEKMPSRGHGLKFHPSLDLLKNSAQIEGGTFETFLNSSGFNGKVSSHITLEDILLRTIELIPDCHGILSTHPYALPVAIEADPSSLYLDLHSSRWETVEVFASQWQSDFPKLKDFFEIVPGKMSLRLKEENKNFLNSYNKVGNLCDLYLEVDLRPKDSSYWYLIRNINSQHHWSRAAYYMCGMFILGSIVRYEPETMLLASSRDSKTGWLIKRFLAASQRYAPNLILNWFYETNFFFGQS